MAVTKIKPIRGTVNKALAYILDPAKTDDQLYVSSFGCAASDAAAKEFEWTRNLAAQQGMQMPKVIARHLIQSFDIGEVTPEQAHEIGKQFADEWLKGKYEYVIATHIDKGHCHNHIIFILIIQMISFIEISNSLGAQGLFALTFSIMRSIIINGFSSSSFDSLINIKSWFAKCQF